MDNLAKLCTTSEKTRTMYFPSYFCNAATMQQVEEHEMINVIYLLILCLVDA